jgi:hypothetical protein
LVMIADPTLPRYGTDLNATATFLHSQVVLTLDRKILYNLDC